MSRKDTNSMPVDNSMEAETAQRAGFRATAEDEVVSRIIADMVPDGACLQIGVGALPKLVCAALRDRNDLGLRTEALNPGPVDLIRAGAVTNRCKAIDHGKTVFTFAMGQKAMYDFLNDNPAIASVPVDYVNDPRTIAQNDNVVSLSAATQIGPNGACNSEHMLGHQYSASGGQRDFVRGAYASIASRPGSECSSIDKLNRGHAILGTSSQRIAIYPGDWVTALAVMDASTGTLIPRGTRTIRVVATEGGGQSFVV
jgi:acyl-CoA hydrolase